MQGRSPFSWLQFQSLVGFKINWNKIGAGAASGILFQSLVGFKINWNSIRKRDPLSLEPVSIPSRV